MGRRDGAIPGGRKQPLRLTRSKTVGTLPAHAGGAGRFGHAARPGEHVEEIELTLRGPTIMAAGLAGMFESAHRTSLMHNRGRVGQHFLAGAVSARRDRPPQLCYMGQTQ